MKIDIEGHEFRIMPTFFENNKMKKIKQLVIEFHTPGDIHLHPTYFNGLGDIHHEDLWNILEQISLTHTLVHIHANNACDIHTVKGALIPNVFECTYIRNDFATNKTPETKPFPTPLDYPNHPHKPDLILSGYPYLSEDENNVNKKFYVSKWF